MIHWNRCICSNHLSVSTILPLIVDLYCFSMDVLRRLDCLLFVFLNNCNSLFYTVFLQSYLINIWFYSVRKYSGYRFEPQFNHFCNCSEISQICDWIFMNVWKQIQRMFEIGFLEKNHESTMNSIFFSLCDIKCTGPNLRLASGGFDPDVQFYEFPKVRILLVFMKVFYDECFRLKTLS